MRTTAPRILQARYLCHTPCHKQISWSGAQNAPQGPQRCVSLCMHLPSPSPSLVMYVIFYFVIQYLKEGRELCFQKKLRTETICVQRKRASAAPHSRGLPGLSVSMSVSLTSGLCLCICVLFAFLTRWTIIRYCVMKWLVRSTGDKGQEWK